MTGSMVSGALRKEVHGVSGDGLEAYDLCDGCNPRSETGNEI